MIRLKLLLLMSTMLIPLAFSLETGPGLDSSDLTIGTDSHTRTGRLVVRKGMRLFPDEAKETNGRKVQAGLTDHSEGYQADSPGSAGSYKAAEDKLQRLNPTVHCGGDSMALRIQGNRVPNFMVDRGEEGIVPVTQLPAHCGISMKRVRRDVLVVAQYQGCHVTQEGDNYVLPLRLWGISMGLCCPVASTAQDPSAVLASDPQQNWLASGPFPYYPGDQFYQQGNFWPLSVPSTAAPTPSPSTEAPVTATTPAPSTAAPSTAAPTPASTPVIASDPLQNWYPFGPFPYQHGYPHGYLWQVPIPAPSTAAPTPASTPVLASDPQQNWYPFGPFPYHHRYPHWYFWQAPNPAPSTAASTTAPTTAPSTDAPTTASIPASTVPASDPQQNWYPFGPFPYHHRYPHWYFWQAPTPAPSTAASTTAPTPASSTDAPTTAPTPAPSTDAPTTASTPASAVPASDPLQDWYPIDPPPYYQGRKYCPYGHGWQYPTAAPGTAAPAPTTTTSVSDPQQNWYNPNGFYSYGYPWMQPAKSPWFTSHRFSKGDIKQPFLYPGAIKN